MDINDSGQIVGTGVLNGEKHGYLLTPIPEPATFAGLLTLAAVMATVGIRRVARGHRSRG